MVRGVEAEGGVVREFTGGVGDKSAFAADECAEALAGGGEQAKKKSDGFKCDLRRVRAARQQRHDHAR